MSYIKEDLETMLKNHLKNKAKKIEMQLKREEYEERLNYAGTVYKDTEEEIIENMQLAGHGYDTIHSNTNKISDKTANTAMMYKKEQTYINKEDRDYLKNRICECEKEEKRLDKIIKRVENLLEQLSKEESFIIKSYYFEKSKWDYVSQQYCTEFQKPKSINQLLITRDRAIESILEILNFGIK